MTEALLIDRRVVGEDIGKVELRAMLIRDWPLFKLCGVCRTLRETVKDVTYSNERSVEERFCGSFSGGQSEGRTRGGIIRHTARFSRYLVV